MIAVDHARVPMRAIFSSDDNPFYLSFRDIVSCAWQKIGIDPLFVKAPLGGPGYCPTDIVPAGTQAQMLRVLLPALFPDDVFITTDIDMLPLSRSYFQSALEPPLRAHEIINLSADAYHDDPARFPICYFIATGNTFATITGIRDEKDVAQALPEWLNQGHGWFTDEVVFGRLLRRAERDGHIIFTPRARGWNKGLAIDRVDRANWQIDRRRLRNHQYIDAHMLRPLAAHRHRLRPLFEYVAPTKQAYVRRLRDFLTDRTA